MKQNNINADMECFCEPSGFIIPGFFLTHFWKKYLITNVLPPKRRTPSSQTFAVPGHLSNHDHYLNGKFIHRNKSAINEQKTPQCVFKCTWLSLASLFFILIAGVSKKFHIALQRQLFCRIRQSKLWDRHSSKADIPPTGFSQKVMENE